MACTCWPPNDTTPVDGNERILCLDAAGGEVLWKHEYASRYEISYPCGPRATPTLADGNLFALGATGLLQRLDPVTGEQVWQRDINEDAAREPPTWGYASSPLLHEGRLYVQVLHGMRTDDPSYVVALDAATGKEVWAVERWTDALSESPDSYTTPALLQLDGRFQIVITGGDYVTGHDSESGEEVWRAAGLNPNKNRNSRIVASPVAMNGMVYAPTRVRPLLALNVSDGEYTEATDLAWKWNQTGSPDVPTPIWSA